MLNILTKIIFICFFTLGAYANVTSLLPKKDAINVPEDIKIQITFDKPIISSSINNRTIKLKTDNKKVNGLVSFKDKFTLVFTPNNNLKTGTYSLHVKSIKLKNPDPIKPKTWFQRIIYRICSMFYNDIRDCIFYNFFFGNNGIKTNKINYSFVVNNDILTIKTLNLKSTQEKLKENSKANLTLKATYSDGNVKDITKNIQWSIQDNSIVSVNNTKLKALKEGTTTLSATVDDITSNEINITVYKEKPPIVELLSPINNVNHAHVTLEINAINTQKIVALNRTLITDENKTIFVKGVKNKDKFYFYNIPLIKGVNTIELNATNGTLNTLKNIDINSDANGSAPIAMRASKYTAVQNLQSNIEVGTLLDVQEYLFDVEGDGIIDEVSSEGNFTVKLNQEGRYKPRVTIRTKDNVLYSSKDFALSLDVKANENQKDPKGAEPIDVAKSYTQAIIDNDRESVERLLGNNKRLINYIYANPKVQPFLADTYKNITSWEQTYHDSGYTSVKIMIDVNGTQYGGGFEMVTINPQIKTGREWIIRFFY